MVEITTEGFQVLDTRTKTLRADVCSSRTEAEAACEDLNDPTTAPAGAA